MKKIAIILEDQFDEQELIYPYHRLREDYQVDLISPEKKAYKSKSGFEIEASQKVADINAEDYVGVYIPGGFSPDYMRRSEELKDFLKEMDQAKKPIAAICHGPWMIASCVDIKGRDITSFFSIKDDLVNAGANYLDQEVVVDGNLVTSRSPEDLPAHVKAFIELIEA